MENLIKSFKEKKEKKNISHIINGDLNPWRARE